MTAFPELKRQLETMPPEIMEAHAHSIRNRSEVISSARCACFHCCQVFPSSEISHWSDQGADGVGQTALCPRCGIDSVISEAAGFVLSESFLAQLKARWFEQD